MVDWTKPNEIIDFIELRYNQAGEQRDLGAADANTARNYFNTGDYTSALNYTLYAVSHALTSIGYLEALKAGIPPNASFALIYLLETYGVFVWQDIIELIVFNEYECAVAMTYTLDKMRKTAWNKPFLLAHALNPELYGEE